MEALLGEGRLVLYDAQLSAGRRGGLGEGGPWLVLSVSQASCQGGVDSAWGSAPGALCNPHCDARGGPSLRWSHTHLGPG